MMIAWIMAGAAMVFAGIACLSVFWFDHEEVKRDDR
jgi:hypothetical protein